MKILRLLLSVYVFLLSCALHAEALYPFDTPEQGEQFNHLLRNLRCLVCQNQDLADSNAGLANDLRAEVYRHVKAGENTDEIIAYLTTRYGDFILFNPPVKSTTFFLWLGPMIFLLIGFFIFWMTTRHD